MTNLEQHEIFEIEILQRLKSARLLNPLVFGGGTMLRLCYGLNRYSADLDFWFIREFNYEVYQSKIIDTLKSFYEITDNQIKHFSLLIELRSPVYPKRLKVEIRKYETEFEMDDMIAYSPHSTIQVILRVHSLRQAMINKVTALLDRAEIRDAFDIEFLLRRGASLPELTERDKIKLNKKISNFKDSDFKVKLGSLLDSDTRDYYNQNKFRFLESFLKLV